MVRVAEEAHVQDLDAHVAEIMEKLRTEKEKRVALNVQLTAAANDFSALKEEAITARKDATAASMRAATLAVSEKQAAAGLKDAEDAIALLVETQKTADVAVRDECDAARTAMEAAEKRAAADAMRMEESHVREIARLASELNSKLEQCRDEHATHITTRDVELAAAQLKLHDADEGTFAAKESADQLRSELESTCAAVIDLQAQLAAAQAKLATASEVARSVDSEAMSLRIALRDARGEVTELSQRTQVAESKLATRKARVQALQEELKQMKRAGATALENVKSNLNEQKGELVTELENVRSAAALATSEAQEAAKNAAIEHANEVFDLRASHTDELASVAERTRLARAAELLELKEVESAARAVAAEQGSALATLEEELAVLKAELLRRDAIKEKNKARRVADAKSADDERKKLEDAHAFAIASAESRSSSVESELAERAAALATCEASLSTAVVSLAEVNAASELTSASLAATHTELKLKLSAASNEVTESAATVNSLTADLSAERERAQTLQFELSELDALRVREEELLQRAVADAGSELEAERKRARALLVETNAQNSAASDAAAAARERVVSKLNAELDEARSALSMATANGAKHKSEGKKSLTRAVELAKTTGLLRTELVVSQEAAEKEAIIAATQRKQIATLKEKTKEFVRAQRFKADEASTAAARSLDEVRASHAELLAEHNAQLASAEERCAAVAKTFAADSAAAAAAADGALADAHREWIDQQRARDEASTEHMMAARHEFEKELHAHELSFADEIKRRDAQKASGKARRAAAATSSAEAAAAEAAAAKRKLTLASEEALAAAMGELEAQLAARDESIKLLAATMAAAGAEGDAELEALRATLVTYEMSAAAAEDELSALQSVMEAQRAEVDTELDAVRTSHSDREVVLRRTLEAAVATAAEAADSAEAALSAARFDLEEQLRSKEENIVSLEALLATSRADSESARREHGVQVAEYEEVAAAAQTDLSAANVALTQSNVDAGVWEAELEAANAAAERLSRSLSRCEERSVVALSELQCKLTDARVQEDRLLVAAVKWKDTSSTQAADLAALISEVELLRIKEKETTVELSSLQAGSAIAAGLQRALERRVETENAARRALEEETEDHSATLTVTLVAVDTLKEQLAIASARCDELEEASLLMAATASENDGARADAVELLQSQLSGARSAADLREADVESLTERLAKSEAQCKVAQAAELNAQLKRRPSAPSSVTLAATAGALQLEAELTAMRSEMSMEVSDLLFDIFNLCMTEYLCYLIPLLNEQNYCQEAAMKNALAASFSTFQHEKNEAARSMEAQIEELNVALHAAEAEGIETAQVVAEEAARVEAEIGEDAVAQLRTELAAMRAAGIKLAANFDDRESLAAEHQRVVAQRAKLVQRNSELEARARRESAVASSVLAKERVSADLHENRISELTQELAKVEARFNSEAAAAASAAAEYASHEAMHSETLSNHEITMEIAQNSTNEELRTAHEIALGDLHEHHLAAIVALRGTADNRRRDLQNVLHAELESQAASTSEVATLTAELMVAREPRNADARLVAQIKEDAKEAADQYRDQLSRLSTAELEVSLTAENLRAELIRSQAAVAAARTHSLRSRDRDDEVEVAIEGPFVFLNKAHTLGYCTFYFIQYM